MKIGRFGRLSYFIAISIIGLFLLSNSASVFAAPQQIGANTDGGGQADSGATDSSVSAPSIDACDSLKDSVARDALGCDNNTSENQLVDIIVNILNTVIAISGLVAVIFIIMGGVGYMTSTGDPSKIKKAKDTILYACIGLVVCVLAFAIVNWAIGAISGS